MREFPAPSPRFILFSSLARVAQLREGFAIEDLKGTPGKVPRTPPIAQGPDNAAYRAPMQKPSTRASSDCDTPGLTTRVRRSSASRCRYRRYTVCGSSSTLSVIWL